MTLNDLIVKAVALSNQSAAGDVKLVFPRERLTLDPIQDIQLEYNEREQYVEVKLISPQIVIE